MDWKHHFILLKETILLSGLFCHLVTQVDKKTINRSRCFKGLVCSTVHQMFLDLGVRSKRGVMPFFSDSPCFAVTKCKNSLNSLLRRGNFELISQRVGCPKMHRDNPLDSLSNSKYCNHNIKQYRVDGGMDESLTNC